MSSYRQQKTPLIKRGSLIHWPNHRVDVPVTNNNRNQTIDLLSLTQQAAAGAQAGAHSAAKEIQLTETKAKAIMATTKRFIMIIPPKRKTKIKFLTWR